MNKPKLLESFKQKKAIIGILMGGFSSEREISLKSGNAVSVALSSLGYKIKNIDINSPDIFQSRHPDFDVAFIALHGKFGEDGGIQSVLELYDVAYTGSGVEASRRAMDKFVTKEAFIKHKIPTAEYITINNEQNPMTNFPSRLNDAVGQVGYPIVVKPRAEGSSVGVSIIQEPTQLEVALKEAYRYGPDVLIEKYIAGREVTVGILGDNPLPVIELKPKQDFYNYEAKYQDTRTEYIVNPDFPENVIKEIQSIGLSAHKALGCSGISRVDLIYSEQIGPIVLEVNTIPGLTERSLLPKAAKAINIDFPQLCERIIELALC